ncbi:MAG TPA: cyclic nucleotide-binding domain-containing protein [Oceanipulchritudo sp.]|nr:cyclic nucleotide-binding domain-containing protein [Oceanipulchritudo sp.]
MARFRPLSDFASVNAILSRTAFLGGLNDGQLETIYPTFETATFQKGDFIACCGEDPSHIFIIRSGKVALFIYDGDRSVRKRTFEVGDSFGEAALLSLVNTSASFLAEEKTELIAFSRKALNQLHRDEPTIFCHIVLNIARDLARKLQYTDAILVRGQDS